MRKVVRARDKGCQLAGDGTECNGRLEVHHLRPVRFGGEPYALENLALVCRQHHEVIERSFRALTPWRSRPSCLEI
jgi:hypothetical protein